MNTVDARVGAQCRNTVWLRLAGVWQRRLMAHGESFIFEHFHIILQEEKITIDEEEYFDNLNQLVEVGEDSDKLNTE